MKEQRKGYTWVETSTGGYWSKLNPHSKHMHARPLFCPHCQRITGTVDDDYYEAYGFCYLCFTMHVDERDTPTIDIEHYRNLKDNKQW